MCHPSSCYYNYIVSQGVPKQRELSVIMKQKAHKKQLQNYKIKECSFNSNLKS